jgi:hypothetical protein
MKSYNKKIVIFALGLLILAGIIVVVLKGFNVSLDLREHDTLKFVFDQKFEKSDIDGICKEVFDGKEYKIKTVEVFTDAIYIIAPTITENEEEALLTKLNDLYKDSDEESSSTYVTNEDGSVVEEQSDDEVVEENSEEISIYDKLEKEEDYDFYTDAKIRIRDIVRPYVVPTIISAIIICIYVAIKYNKLHEGKIIVTVGELLGKMIVLLAVLLSLIAIFRLPFTGTVIPILMFIMLVFLVLNLSYLEIQLKKMKSSK